MSCVPWLQVYLYVLSSKRLVGCVVVEKINSASPVATSSKTLLSGFDSPVASAQPSTYIQPLTPLSAPPLGQHSQSDHGDRRTAAIAATGVSCPMSARQRLDSNELPVPHLSLPLQDLNHGHAVYQPRPALHTALHRGTLQHASRKDTLLTRWLAASKCKATFGNCAARLQAEQPSSASSAVGCKVGSQEASRVDLGCTSPQCSNVACPDHLNHHAHTMHCGASEHTAVLTDGKVDQGMQPPDTPSVAAQTEEVVGSFNTSAQASSMTGPTSDDCGTSSFDCAAARSPAQPVGILAAKQSRPQHIVLMDTTKSVKADCGIKVMWVSNEHQRRGIATQLLDAVR